MNDHVPQDVRLYVESEVRRRKAIAKEERRRARKERFSKLWVDGVYFIKFVIAFTLIIFFIVLLIPHAARADTGKSDATASSGGTHTTTFVFSGPGPNLVLIVPGTPPPALLAGLTKLGMIKSTLNPPPNCAVEVVGKDRYAIQCMRRPVKGDCGLQRAVLSLDALTDIVSAYRRLCPAETNTRIGKELDA